MAHSYPIWYDVSACIYQSSKSFGAKDTSDITINVGSSAKNSHELCNIMTTKRSYYSEEYGYDVVSFKFSVDGHVTNEKVFKDKGGEVAGELLYSKTRLTSKRCKTKRFKKPSKK